MSPAGPITITLPLAMSDRIRETEACDELDRDPTAVMTLNELGEELKVEYARALQAG